MFLFLFLFISSFDIMNDWRYDMKMNENERNTKERIRFRVAQWNIGKLNKGKSGHTSISKTDRDARILDFHTLINDVGADVLSINEYAPFFSITDSLLEDSLDLTKDAILSMYSYAHQGNRYGANCNFIASLGFPLENFQEIDYRIHKQHRYYAVCNMSVNGTSIKIVSTHLDTPQYEMERSQQIEELISAFSDDPYVIICGDFNINDSKEYEPFIVNGYTMANHGILNDIITFPSNKGGKALDNIICKGLDIIGIKVYKTKLSDHYLLACDVVLKED